jgi:hypothetical protein
VSVKCESDDNNCWLSAGAKKRRYGGGLLTATR